MKFSKVSVTSEKDGIDFGLQLNVNWTLRMWLWYWLLKLKVKAVKLIGILIKHCFPVWPMGHIKCDNFQKQGTNVTDMQVYADYYEGFYVLYVHTTKSCNNSNCLPEISWWWYDIWYYARYILHLKPFWSYCSMLQPVKELAYSML